LELLFCYSINLSPWKEAFLGICHFAILSPWKEAILGTVIVLLVGEVGLA